MISPDEYMKSEGKGKVLSPEEYLKAAGSPKVVSPEEYIIKNSIRQGKDTTKPFKKKMISPMHPVFKTGMLASNRKEFEKFESGYPNLFGGFGVLKAFLPYIDYIDPQERDRFAKLTTQKQTRELLLQNLETITAGAAPLITKGAVPLVAKYLPKTFKALQFAKTPIKEMKALAKTPAREVAGKAMAKGEKLVANKIQAYKNFAGENPTPKLIMQWWKDSAMAIRPEATAALTAKAIVEKAKKSPVEKITQAIKEAKPIRKAQERLYTQERSKRIGKAMAVGEKVPGEKGFYAQLGKLKGPMPKVTYESIRSKISQPDIDELFNAINRSTDVTGFENITAKRGLAKLLGEAGTAIPQDNELNLLRKIFGTDFTNTLLKKQTSWQKIKHGLGELINIPRSVMSSFDLSAPFRQGLFLVNRPKQFLPAFGKMFKLFGSEKSFQAIQQSITKKPTYQLMKDSGLAIVEAGKKLALREERFQSQWAEKIPIVGSGIRASGRAYMGFLNKLRADVFDDLVGKAQRLGLDPQNNMDLTKQIAHFINAATGRGSLGSLERAAVGLNGLFFSPRLMSSRLTLLNPVYYIKADPFVRKEALKSLFTLAGGISSVLTLAKAGGAEVGTDWRSADFGKIKIGNTRLDIMGGFQQYIRAAGQLITGQYVSSTTGRVITLGEGYRPLTRLEILYKQIESKEAPVFSFITTLLKGQDFKGEKISVPKEIGKRFVPMAMQDIYEIAQDDPALLPASSLGLFGVGIQTYESTRSTGKSMKLKKLESL